MGYVDNNLMPGENIIYKANIHWFIFVPGVVIFVLGIYLFTVDTEGGTGPVFGFIAIIIALFSLIKAMIGGFNSQVQQMSGFRYATNLLDSEYTFEGVA